MPIYLCLLSHFVILFNSWRFCLILSVFLSLHLCPPVFLSIYLPTFMSLCLSFALKKG